MRIRHFAVLISMGVLVACASSAPAPAPSGSAQQGPDSQAMALVAQAQLRLERGEFAEGIQLFRRAVALEPNDNGLAEEFGLALSRAGVDDEAIKVLRGVKDPSPEAAAALGMLLMRAPKSDAELQEAVRYLERGLDDPARGVAVRYHLAQALLQLGKGDEAWTVLQPLLTDRPTDPRLQLMAGQALKQAGKLDEALGYLTKAEKVFETGMQATAEIVDVLARQGKYEEAAKRWKGLIDRGAVGTAGIARYATLLLRAGDRDQARKVLDDLLASNPKFVEAITLRAVVALGDGDVAQAEQLYRRALATAPDDPDVQMGLARLLVELRRTDEARTLLDGLWARVEKGELTADAGHDIAQERAALELLDRNSDKAAPWLDRLGSVNLDRRSLALWTEYFRQRKAFAEGLVWLGKATVESGDEVARLKQTAEAEFRFETGDADGAMAVLQPLLSGDEDDAASALGVLDGQKRFSQAAELARSAIARLGEKPALQFALAASLERMGEFDAAVAEFRTLLKADPENASALNYLGYMFADKNVNLDESLRLIEKAVALAPTSGAFLDSLGWVYFRKDDLDKAEKYLTQSVALEPFDASVHEHLGDLFRARGMADKARAAYQKALSLGPEEVGQKERIEEKIRALEAHAAP